MCNVAMKKIIHLKTAAPHPAERTLQREQRGLGTEGHWQPTRTAGQREETGTLSGVERRPGCPDPAGQSEPRTDLCDLCKKNTGREKTKRSAHFQIAFSVSSNNKTVTTTCDFKFAFSCAFSF